MKRTAILLVLSLCLLSACVLPRASSLQPTETVTLVPSATATWTPSATVTPSSVPSLTETASPAATETATASIQPTESATPGPSETPRDTRTPVPSPLTPLPTFSPKKIVTLTPGLQAICPTEDPAVVANFPEQGLAEPDKILAYLNAGGSLAIFDERPELLGQGKAIDLTGDGFKELIYGSGHYYYFFRCINGTYQPDPFRFGLDTQLSADLQETVDLNQNGIPEIFFASFGHDGVASIYIYEWDGNGFRSLIQVQPDAFDRATSDFVDTQSQYDLVDTNGDGLKEVVLVDDVGASQTEGLPFRNQTIILSWDGSHYVNLRPGDYGPPHFRFQAVQDADRQVLYGNYTQAMTLYQQVISSDELDWWSKERRDDAIKTFYNPGAVFPTLVMDTNEREQLSAYAYYRMVILHVYLGQIGKAQAKYATLREKFPVGDAGHAYVEMAHIFLDYYQASQKIQTACIAVVAYADQHLEILTPLGTGDRGLTNHAYRSEDTCPRLAQKE